MATVPDDRPLVLLLDNASFHHSAVSEGTLAFSKTVPCFSGYRLIVQI